MYRLLIKPFVRRMSPERANRFSLGYFKFIGMIPGGRALNRLIHGNRPAGLQSEVFGLSFYNPVGLGAGLDTRGDLYNDLNDLGFSYVEIGPLDAESTRHAIRNIQNDPQNDILAACIAGDHLTSFSLAYDFCDFFVIDLDNENGIHTLDDILDSRLGYEVYKPVVAKFPEGIKKEQVDAYVDYCLMNHVDGIQVRNFGHLLDVYERSKGRIHIIANCHIETPEEAEKMLKAGASLIEIHSGLVHSGPSIVRKTLKRLENNAKTAKNGK